MIKFKEVFNRLKWLLIFPALDVSSTFLAIKNNSMNIEANPVGKYILHNFGFGGYFILFLLGILMFVLISFLCYRTAIWRYKKIVRKNGFEILNINRNITWSMGVFTGAYIMMYLFFILNNFGMFSLFK